MSKDERIAIYVAKLEALVDAAKFRALTVGGSAIHALETSVHISDLRAYVEALCRHKKVPVFKAATKHRLAEFAIGNV